VTRRAVVALLGASIVVLLIRGAVASEAGAAGSTGVVQLSTRVISPGETVVVSGSGWPEGTGLSAELCGAKAVSGSADCAESTTVTMQATSRGLLWKQMIGAIPPEPCPCVVLFTGFTNGYTHMIPVQVVGASSAPVRPITPSAPPKVRISTLTVTKVATLASSFGGPAQRSVEVRITNPGNGPVTPTVVARWGSGDVLSNVIPMPPPRQIDPGQTWEIRRPFALGAFAMGTYAVRVQVELVGFVDDDAVKATTTSQWPVALFVLGGVLILLIGIAVAVRRR
jgi:hypothetical protein